ncbi:structure-specific endonuclease subunit SLX4 isoform X1 [Pieris brassicae]|uniref:structure-specific endonuclease subunit SLX4 isoform X1 n=2 Tax=Pieris brassicae TaxID=7116 RepID=UPI001E6613F8|nr:structure-specific endonuclease subunit SLX4 isoform X1 [Pieris brassicae]
MNVNSFSHGASTSKIQVTSKYFSNEAVLDESLTEFQEKRKIAGPKNPHKKPPKRKCQKRIKGQKDIRTLIKKKNDLIEYSKNFNKICKNSGVDIDSEQLQLAIALSNSLHDSKQCPIDTDVTKPLTSREKCNRIRTTLQEYGFQVPEVKATNLNKIKQKRYNLLTTSDEEKQQIISAKYMQILSSNSNDIIIESNLKKDSIYYKTTCMLFEEMKNDVVFYVNGLIEKSLNTIFLRNWSDIPGRCQSPVFEGPYIGFNDIICSQDELDVFLSGYIAIIQNICYVKLRNYSFQTGRLFYNTSHESVEQAMSSKILSNETLSLSLTEKINNLQHKDIDILNNDNEKNYIVNDTLSQPLSMVTEYIDSETDLQEQKTVAFCVSKSLNETTISRYICKSPDLFDEEVSTILNMSSKLSKPIVIYDTIDLTQCVPSNIKPQVANVSKRLANDVMELTECIGRDFYSEDKIDLTQELNDDDTIVYVDEDVNCRKTGGSLEILECDKVIILDEINTASIVPDSVADVIKENIQTIDTMNLTESSDTCDSFPDIKVRGEDKKGTMDNINDTLYDKLVTEEPNFKSRDNESNIETDKLIRNNISFFVKDNSSNENIELTQPKEYNYCSRNSDLSKMYNLGKIDNLSVDYDDMFDQIIKNSTNASKSTDNSNEYNTQNKNSSFSNSEKLASDSESYKLSDQELNYSVNICVDSIKNDFEDLPSIDMNCQKNSVECILTPVKEKNFEIIKTPSNNEYIIKTVDVTPMQNFEAMSSPERNKELEKYGLKPFKRKRAIQLLTYIYNQTHPVVESCEDGSPTKKQKLNSPQKIITGNLSQSPRKSQKSPRKNNISVKKSPAISQDVCDKENIFIQTDNTPAIKNIACEPEDWVFQKREKAKVHSCRVPLHIAFHNYVSCRRLLREAILCYEPINIDIVHKDLIAAGYRYNPKDLLKFMDKKCITVKTADNNARNKR